MEPFQRAPWFVLFKRGTAIRRIRAPSGYKTSHKSKTYPRSITSFLLIMGPPTSQTQTPLPSTPPSSLPPRRWRIVEFMKSFTKISNRFSQRLFFFSELRNGK